MIKPNNLVFYSSDSGTWQRLFKEQGTEINEIFAGGSVALDAMALALDWGFSRIIMIGQDLAMTGNRQYADGNELNAMTQFNSPTLYVKDIYGNDILTKKDYYTFIQSIEDLAYRNADVDFIDATEGGAYKKHTRIMTLQEAISQYCVKSYDITGMIEAVPRRFTDGGAHMVLNILQEMKGNLTELSGKLRVGYSDCMKAAGMLIDGRFDKQELRDINERNRALDESYADAEEHILIKKYAAQANYEFGSTVYQTLDDDIRESIRLYQNSAKLYQGIADSIEELLKEICSCEEAERGA